MKKITSLLLLLVCFAIQASAQSGTLVGTVLDEKKEPLVNALIKITQGGIEKGNAVTDGDGSYIIKPLAPGRYDVKASYKGYKSHLMTGVIISPDKTTGLNFQLQLLMGDNQTAVKQEEQEDIVIHAYKLPLIDRYSPVASRKTSEQIEKMPTRVANGIASPNSGYVSNNLGIVSSPTPAYYNPSVETYAKVKDNDFMTVKANPLSTLSVDVDRASYSNIRRFLNSGQLPPADAVRVEEMINYFDYDYPQPKGKDPIAITTELIDCPWQKGHKLLHVGMQAKEISTENLPASNIVFLIDVSGSMAEANKLPLVKSALKLLVSKLRTQDKLSIVVYAGAAGLVLPPTSGNDKETIIAALDNLQAGGSTAGGAGIKLAYKTALDNFIKGGNNRVVLATDGDFNVGASGENELENLITKERENGIYLTCLGFGMGNYKDSKMEILADKGNGNYAYIDNILEAEKTLVKEFGGTIFTLAKDVKAQIEFNPAYVQSYRLVGYENRLLNAEDFKDDKKDAGEMGSGHTVTILYEIIPVGSNSPHNRGVDGLKYQDKQPVEDISSSNELATIKFRYKKPDGDKSKEMVHIISRDTKSLMLSGNNIRFAASVAMFGMLLKNSAFKGVSTYDMAYNLAKSAKGNDNEGYRAEYMRLVKIAEKQAPNTAVGMVEED